jgi:hypothetical protein
LLSRASVPFDTATSSAPVAGTILDLSRLEATETATTNNGIGRSRFSSLATPMELGIRIDPPFIGGASVLPPLAFVATPLPAVLTQAFVASNSQFVGTAISQAQAQAVAQDAIAKARFNSYLGNSGLQPNWLAPDGVPGINPFASPVVEPVTAPIQAAPVPAPVPVPQAPAPEVAKPSAVQADQAKVDDDCAKPRVVAKPRPANPANATPKFAPGSEAAKRFSDQVKRARLRARC